jgi:hypothetical protein
MYTFFNSDKTTTTRWTTCWIDFWIWMQTRGSQ